MLIATVVLLWCGCGLVAQAMCRFDFRELSRPPRVLLWEIFILGPIGIGVACLASKKIGFQFKR